MRLLSTAAALILAGCGVVGPAPKPSLEITGVHGVVQGNQLVALTVDMVVKDWAFSPVGAEIHDDPVQVRLPSFHGVSEHRNIAAQRPVLRSRAEDTRENQRRSHRFMK